MCMDHINALMQDMSLCHVIPTESEWRLVIWAYIKSGSLDLCETIIEQSNDWCAQFDKVLWEKVDVGSDPHTHEVDRAHMAIKNASHINQVSTRAIFFDILSQALISVGKSHSLWLLVKALAGPIDSVDGEWSYTNVGSIDSFEVLIGLFYNLRLPDRCISVIEAMRNQGISPTHQCYIYTIESMVNCYTTHNTLGLEFTEKGTPSFDQHEAAKTVSEFYCNIPTDRLTLPIIENVLIITEHIPSQSLLPRIWYDIQKLSAQFKEATYWSLCKSYLVCQCGTYFSLLALDIFRHFLARRDLIPNPHNQAHHERFLLMCLEHHHAVVYSAHFRLMLGTGVRIDSAICTRALEMTPDKHLRIPILRYMWVNEMDVPVHI
ncbi:hypothetical protein BASA60_002821 [Batrachochytrium salamandrivorans]|nr:hypothetical protein BASA60_002821 [Batrachochytrium salamandrivorans]KAH9248139.1 hypothetical protein BASA81_014213 [Batrachochytrium salamandrivorans]